MDKNEHAFRTEARNIVEMVLTASLDMGDCIEMLTIAAERFAASKLNRPATVLVVSWPIKGEEPVRQAKGFYDTDTAMACANANEGAEIFKLEVS